MRNSSIKVLFFLLIARNVGWDDIKFCGMVRGKYWCCNYFTNSIVSEGIKNFCTPRVGWMVRVIDSQHQSLRFESDQLCSRLAMPSIRWEIDFSDSIIKLNQKRIINETEPYHFELKYMYILKKLFFYNISYFTLKIKGNFIVILPLILP